jgi:hypothetical protein
VAIWLQDPQEEEILYSNVSLKGVTRQKIVNGTESFLGLGSITAVYLRGPLDLCIPSFGVHPFTVTGNGGKRFHINRSKKLCTTINEINFHSEVANETQL